MTFPNIGAFAIGERVRLIDTVNVGKYMEGEITARNNATGNTTIVTSVSTDPSSTTGSSWILATAGIPGINGAQGVQGTTGSQGPQGSTGLGYGTTTGAASLILGDNASHSIDISDKGAYLVGTRLRISPLSVSGAYVEGNITAITGTGPYTVTYLQDKSSGLPQSGSVVSNLALSVAGTSGSQGVSGPQGPQGAPGSGGGSGGIDRLKYFLKASGDNYVVSNSDVVVDIPGFSFYLEPSKTYEINAIISFRTTSVNAGARLTYTSPAQTTCGLELIANRSAAQNNTDLKIPCCINTGTVVGTSTTDLYKNQHLICRGFITGGGDAVSAPFKLQFAVETNGYTAYMMKESYVRVMDMTM
jgi:hypothetical protein